MEEAQLWRQYIIAAIACLARATTGYCMGWTSPMNVKLKDEEGLQSPLPQPISSEEESWIGSLLTIGAIFGPFAGGLAVSTIGRKWGLLCSCIPKFLGWILIAAATDVIYLYIGRILWGLGVGMDFTITPMYLAEIATDNARGILGSLLQLYMPVGFLIVYSVGPYTTYSQTAYVGVGLLSLFALLFYLMPETPIHHLSKNDRQSAEESLAAIRGWSVDGVQPELDKMADSVNIAVKKEASIAAIFKRGNFKAFYLSCALVQFQQLCGITPMFFYLSNIFEAAGSDLDSAIASIITISVQLVASMLTPLVVERLGRRVLLMASSLGMAVGQGLLGLYFILAENNPDLASSIGFLTILSLVLFNTFYCWGVGPLCFSVLSELMPVEIKATATPIVTALYWALSFLITRFFGPMGESLGLYTVFWIFSGSCVLCFFFVLFLLPETKGKSYQEIQEELVGRTKLNRTEIRLAK